MARLTVWKQKVRSLNLFGNVDEASEEDRLLATFIFLTLLLLAIVALLVYSSLTSITKTVIVERPTVTLYKELELKHPNTLTCPCRQILNAYSKFVLSFIPKFNQICSSDFVSDDWLNYVNYRPFLDIKYHYIFDFRHSAYSFFQMLRTLCKLVSQTIDDQLIEFYSTTLLTESAISEDTFLATANATKQQFIDITAASFVTSLNSVQTVVQGNAIANRLATNYYLLTFFHKNNWYDISHARLYPPYCTCIYSSYCKAVTGIYTIYFNNEPTCNGTVMEHEHSTCAMLIQGQLQFRVPGVNVGCLVLDAVLQSDLSCLYNSSCLNELNTYLNDSLYYPFNARPLNISSSPSLSPLKMSDLVDRLLVDEWQFEPSYESYFNQCNPQSCAYTYAKQFDVIYVITTTIGCIGGIVTILMLITLRLVTFTRKRVDRAWWYQDSVATGEQGIYFKRSLLKTADVWPRSSMSITTFFL
ncbi:unnamed protein product [Didymodactylos carnosus]|uniref:Uncharacterized protein n=1 Tax=Didymodactylos carnosus TaxID=1234261 RepID=A0A8S2M508_9BILA|nr:unnamed protein product [Didymodactylos carnosus]CAF3939107.1 unnamed protein product [Didymodactylos carnosus]